MLGVRAVDKHVMVVDDDLGMLALLELILKRNDFSVTRATSAAAVLDMMGASVIVPDVFILDVMMPDMDGYELCKRLRVHPSSKGKPILFVSARSDMLSRNIGLQVGADAYLSKTEVTFRLVNEIRRLLALREAKAG